MTFIAYTSCENGFRHFTSLDGVCVSFDKRFIEHLIKTRGSAADTLKQQHQLSEQQLGQLKAHVELPPQIDDILRYNQQIVSEQLAFAKRLVTAEAVLNGELVREVRFFPKKEQAIKYTVGMS